MIQSAWGAAWLRDLCAQCIEGLGPSLRKFFLGRTSHDVCSRSLFWTNQCTMSLWAFSQWVASLLRATMAVRKRKHQRNQRQRLEIIWLVNFTGGVLDYDVRLISPEGFNAFDVESLQRFFFVKCFTIEGFAKALKVRPSQVAVVTSFENVVRRVFKWVINRAIARSWCKSRRQRSSNGRRDSSGPTPLHETEAEAMSSGDARDDAADCVSDDSCYVLSVSFGAKHRLLREETFPFWEDRQPDPESPIWEDDERHSDAGSNGQSALERPSLRRSYAAFFDQFD